MLDKVANTRNAVNATAAGSRPQLGPAARPGLLFRLLWFGGRRTLLQILDVQVRGRENLPAGGYMLAANHHNWVDPFVLMAILPDEPRVHFIGNAKDTANRWWKRLTTRAMGGLIPVSLDSRAGYREMIARTLAVVNDGGIVGIFPEGRTGPDEDKLLPLKNGVGYFAAHGGVPLVPVGICGTSELYLGRRITVTFAPPIPPADESLPPKKQSEVTVEALRQAIEGILHPYEDRAGEVKRWSWLTNLM